MPSDLTVENPRSDAAITKTATTSVTIERPDDHIFVDVNVEYKPRNQTLRPAALTELMTEYRQSDLTIEWMIVDLYERIIGAVFPGYEGRSKPWEQAPLVVTFEFRVFDGDLVQQSEGTATLGTYR